MKPEPFPCTRCGSPTRIQVQAVISAPGEMYHQFSKSNIAKKEVRLLGVLWDTTDFICTNVQCGYVLDGYGNYVTGIERENEELKERIASFEEMLRNQSFEKGRY